MGSLIKPLVQKIAFECEEAGATKWDIAKIVKELNEIETQSTRKLKEQAIEMLKKLNPNAAETYSSFDQMIVFTSKQELEEFDRGNITKSLLKETKIKRGLAEKISGEVEEKIKDLKISNITTSLIREMVCVKLVELGFEDIHNQYARVGLPVFEIEKIPEIEKEVLKEFNLISKIPFKAKELHCSSTINIPFIEDFSSKGFSWNIELKEKEGPGETIIIDLLKEVKEKQKDFSSSVCINYLNFCLSKAIEKKSKNKIKELIEFFFKASELTQKFCVSIALFTPQESNFKANKKNIWFFANEFIKAFNEKKQKNFELVVCLENKFQLKLLEDNALKTKIYFLNLNNNNLKAQEKGLYVKGQGVSGLSEINFEKLFFKSQGDVKKLMDSIEESVLVVNELFLIKENELKEKINYSDLKKCISLYGVMQGALIFSNQNKAEAKTIARRVREKVRKLAGNAIVLRSFNSVQGKEKFRKFNEKKLGLKEKETELKTTSYFNAKTRKELEEAIEKNFEGILFNPD